MGTAFFGIWVAFNSAAACVGEGIGDTLVWFIDHPLAGLPAAIIALVMIGRSLDT